MMAAGAVFAGKGFSSAASSAPASKVSLGFPHLEAMLPVGMALRECGGGGHCMFYCLTAHLFGKYASAEDGHRSVPGSPSVSFMLVRWLRSIVASLLLDRNELLRMVRAMTVSHNLVKAEGESEDDYLLRWQKPHLEATPDAAVPDAWNQLAVSIRDTARYSTDLDLMSMAFIFGLKLHVHVPGEDGHAQVYDGTAAAVGNSALQRIGQIASMCPAQMGSPAVWSAQEVHLANALDHFKLAVHADRGAVWKRVSQGDLSRMWPTKSAPRPSPDLPALQKWYHKHQASWRDSSMQDEVDASCSSELAVLFKEIHGHLPSHAELDTFLVDRAQYVSITQRLSVVARTPFLPDSDDANDEKSHAFPAQNAPVTTSLPDAYSASLDVEQRKKLEELRRPGVVEEDLRTQMLSGMSEADIRSTCDNAACILCVGELVASRTAKVQTVGDVQSGKTASMEVLTAKAIDKGYDVVIMLSGSNNILRGQTQARLQKRFPSDGRVPSRRWIWLTNERDITQTVSSAAYSAKFHIPFLASAETLRAHMEHVKSTVGCDRVVLLAVVKKSVAAVQLVTKRVLGRLSLGRPARCLIIDDESDDRTVFQAPAGGDEDNGDLQGNQISHALKEVLMKIIELRHSSEPVRAQLNEEQQEAYDESLSEDVDSEPAEHSSDSESEAEDESKADEEGGVMESTVLLTRYTATPQANFLERRDSPLCPDALWLLELAPTNTSYMGLRAWFRRVPIHQLFPCETDLNTFDHVAHWQRLLRQERLERARCPVQCIPYADFHNLGPVEEIRHRHPVTGEITSTVVANQVLPRGLGLKSTGLAQYQAALLRYFKMGKSTGPQRFDDTVVPNRLPPSLLASLADYFITGAVKRWRLDKPLRFIRADCPIQTLLSALRERCFGARLNVPLSLSLDAAPPSVQTPRDPQLSPHVYPLADLSASDVSSFTAVDFLSMLQMAHPHVNDWLGAIRDVADTIDDEADQALEAGNPPKLGALTRMRHALKKYYRKFKPDEHASSEASRQHVMWVLSSVKPHVHDWTCREYRTVHEITVAQGVRITFYALVANSAELDPKDPKCAWDLMQVFDAGQGACNRWTTPSEGASDAVPTAANSSPPHAHMLVHCSDGRETFVRLATAPVDVLTFSPQVQGRGHAERQYHAAIFHFAQAQKVHKEAVALLEEAHIAMSLRLRPWLRRQLSMEGSQYDTNFNALQEDELLPSPERRVRLMFPDADELIRRVELKEAAEERVTAAELRQRTSTLHALIKVQHELVEERQSPDRARTEKHVTEQRQQELAEAHAKEDHVIDAILTIQWERTQLRMGVVADENRRAGIEPQRQPGLHDLVRWLCHVSNRTVVRRCNTDSAGTLKERKMTMFDHDNVYGNSPPVPKNMLLVGGNMLSRGLTIQGLCVSYYTRASVQDAADIAIQAARWLGHRAPSERDLVTLFLQKRQAILYSALYLHDRKLREDIRQHILDRRNIRQSPILLFERMGFNTPCYKLTAAGRMRSATAYGSGSCTQFAEPSLTDSEALKNSNAVSAFRIRLDSEAVVDKESIGHGSASMYRSVPVSLLLEFVGKLHGQRSSDARESPLKQLEQLLRHDLELYLQDKTRINVAIVQPAVRHQEKLEFSPLAAQGRTVWRCLNLLPPQSKEDTRFISPAVFDATAESSGGTMQLTGESRKWFRFPYRVNEEDEGDDTAPQECDFSNPLGLLERQQGAPLLFILHLIRKESIVFRQRDGGVEQEPRVPAASHLPCISCLYPAAYVTAQGLRSDDSTAVWTPIPPVRAKRRGGKTAAAGAGKSGVRLNADGTIPPNAEIDLHKELLTKFFHHIRRSDVQPVGVEFPVWQEPFVVQSVPVRGPRILLTPEIRRKLHDALQLVILSPSLWDRQARSCIFMEPVLDASLEAAVDNHAMSPYRVLLDEADRTEYLLCLEEMGSYPTSLFLLQQWVQDGSINYLQDLELELAVLIYNVREAASRGLSFMGKKSVSYKGRLVVWKLWADALSQFGIEVPLSQLARKNAAAQAKRKAKKAAAAVAMDCSNDDGTMAALGVASASASASASRSRLPANGMKSPASRDHRSASAELSPLALTKSAKSGKRKTVSPAVPPTVPEEESEEKQGASGGSAAAAAPGQRSGSARRRLPTGYEEEEAQDDAKDGNAAKKARRGH